MKLKAIYKKGHILHSRYFWVKDKRMCYDKYTDEYITVVELQRRHMINKS